MAHLYVWQALIMLDVLIVLIVLIVRVVWVRLVPAPPPRAGLPAAAA
jgi:hypothetical protein